MNYQRFVDSPVKVTMFFLALMLMGFLSARRLPLNLFPDLQTPRITVVVETEGLTPGEAERRLTVDFERRIASIRGVAAVTSYSREDSIVLQVDFHWGQDMEFAYLDVKKNVGGLENQDHVRGIEVYRFDPNAAPLITLTFLPDAAGNPVDRVQASNYLENYLKPRLETIEGVAWVRAAGSVLQEVHVLTRDDVMTQYGLTPERVAQAVRQSHLTATGGVVVEGDEEMLLKFVSRFRTVEDVAKCVVTVINEHPVHLEDVGEIRLATSREEARVRQDGALTVGIDVFREPDANAVRTARRLREAVERLNRRGGASLKIAVDRSLEVEAAISEVVRTALWGMVLAMLVLFVFLRNVAATVVAGAAIPLSVIATFSLMDLQGLSLNIMTLGGLALGAGMLVDNGIVVMENIFRHRQSGCAPGEAAARGTGEVALAITAATLTTIVVFVPLVYVHGIAGLLFKDQALTVVYSLLVSLVVALVFIPMLAARIRRARVAEPGLLNRSYGVFLQGSLRLRWLLIIVFAAILAATWQGLSRIPVEFFPEAAAGRVSMTFEMPPGTPLETTDAVAARLEEPLLAIRYRDPALAPLLTRLERWRLARDGRTFLIGAQSALSEIAATDPDHPLLPRLRKLLGGEPVKALLRQEPGLPEEELQRFQPLMRKVDAALSPFIVVESVNTSVGADEQAAAGPDAGARGPHTGRMEITLNPMVLRELSAREVIGLLQRHAATFSGLQCSFESRNEFLQELLGKNRGDLVFEIHAEDVSDLEAATRAAEAALLGTPGLANVRSNLLYGEEQLILEPDMDALSRLGFEIESLIKQIQDYLQGERTEPFKFERGEMEIRVRSPRADREGLNGLLDLEIVSSAQDVREKLRHLVILRKDRGLRELMRVNQERTLLVMGDLGKGTAYQDGLTRGRRALENIDWEACGPGAGWNVSGAEVKRRESFQRLLFAFVLAVVLVYMVIASILESIVHPLTIMFSVPMSFAGVVAAFLLTGVSLNLMGCIGIVMLTGIVVNNAIVLLDRVNQIRNGDRDDQESGNPGDERFSSNDVSLFDAVVLASRQRLRPIVMTSLTTILALLPLAVGYGNGAELRRPMAVAVIGGLTTSTLLTLWILPALYLCVEDLFALFRRATGRGAAPRKEA